MAWKVGWKNEAVAVLTIHRWMRWERGSEYRNLMDTSEVATQVACRRIMSGSLDDPGQECLTENASKLNA